MLIINYWDGTYRVVKPNKDFFNGAYSELVKAITNPQNHEHKPYKSYEII